MAQNSFDTTDPTVPGFYYWRKAPGENEYPLRVDIREGELGLFHSRFVRTIAQIRSLFPASEWRGPVVGGDGYGTEITNLTLEWGPHFGGDAGDEFDLAAAVAMPSVALLMAGLSSTQAVAMPQVAGRYQQHTLTQAVTLPQLRMTTAPNKPRASLVTRLRYSVSAALPVLDTYFDENSPATVHNGTNPLLAKSNAAVGNNRQHTYIAWDLTGIQGTVTSATIDVTVQTTGVVAENVTFNVFTHPTAPLTASSNWTNAEPPPGTQRGTGHTVSAPTAWGTRTLTFDATQRANMPGNWVYLRCTAAGTLGATSLQTRSREHGTPAERPQMTFSVTV